MITLPRAETVNERNLVEMLRLAFRKIAEINDGSVVRDIELRQEVTALRKETRQGFQDVRQEIHDQIGGLRQEMKEEIGGLRQEMKEEVGGLRQEMKEEIGGLRQEMNHALGQQTELLQQLVENTRRD